MTDDSQVARVAKEIETYLETRPDAADDLEGVRSWWIARQRFLEARRTVEAALDRLVEEGRVERRELGDGRVVYRGRSRG